MIKSLKQLGRKSILQLSLLVALLIAGGISTPAHASTSYGYYQPHQLFVTSNECLTYNTFLNDVSQRLYVAQCAEGWTPQLWDIVYVGNGYYNIVSRYDNTRCVDVFAYNQNVLARVVTWTCIPGATNQQWSFTYSSATNSWAIQARHSSLCLQSMSPWVDQNYCYWLVQPRWYMR